MTSEFDSNIVEKTIRLRGAKKMLARRMLESHQNAPAVSILSEAVIGNLTARRDEMNASKAHETGIKLSLTHFLIKALASVLREYPEMNATLQDQEILILKNINIGVATSLSDGGLIVPVVRDADVKAVFEIAEEIARLSAQAREGALSVADLRGGTFTLSNAGMIEKMMWQTPLLNAQQCGIVAIGTAVKRPVVVNDEIKIAQVMRASLTFDHRIVNGVYAASFMRDFLKYLENAGDVSW